MTVIRLASLISATAIFSQLRAAGATETTRSAALDHRCVLDVFECSDASNEHVPMYLFPEVSVSTSDESGSPSTRYMCAYVARNANNTAIEPGFPVSHKWMQLGRKYTTAEKVFQCVADVAMHVIQSPEKRDLCYRQGDLEVPLTHEVVDALVASSDAVDKAQCIGKKRVCQTVPNALCDLPKVGKEALAVYDPSTIVYFESRGSRCKRSEEKSVSYPHGWCRTILPEEIIEQSVLDLAASLWCPCVPKERHAHFPEPSQCTRKFTHDQWTKGKRIRRKHMAGHPGYDPSLPYNCERLCAPHFGFSKKEIDSFPDRDSLLAAMKARGEEFARHTQDPTKSCVIPPSARKSVGCRCALEGKQRTPVKGTSRSLLSLSHASKENLLSPTMISASAPAVSASFHIEGAKPFSASPVRSGSEGNLLEDRQAVANDLLKAEEGEQDRVSASWFPLFLSWLYSAACGCGSTSALYEWWDFLQFITQSTALTLSTICDLFRLAF